MFRISRVFHVIFIIAVVPIYLTLPLELQCGTNILINSSHSANAFEIILSAEGQLNSHFKIFSEALSPVHGKHTLTMDEKLLKIEPEIDEETVLINGYHHSKYLLAFTHPLKSSQHMQSHFLPIEIIDQGESHQLLLPELSTPMSFLPQNSFYKCQNLLISIQNKGGQVELVVFSKVESEGVWVINGKWDSKWRDSSKGLYFGKAKRSNGDLNISITIYTGRICQFSEEKLKERNSQVLNPKKYYGFEDIWNWAPEMKSVPRQTLQDL